MVVQPASTGPSREERPSGLSLMPSGAQEYPNQNNHENPPRAASPGFLRSLLGPRQPSPARPTARTASELPGLDVLTKGIQQLQELQASCEQGF